MMHHRSRPTSIHPAATIPRTITRTTMLARLRIRRRAQLIFQVRGRSRSCPGAAPQPVTGDAAAEQVVPGRGRSSRPRSAPRALQRGHAGTHQQSFNLMFTNFARPPRTTLEGERRTSAYHVRRRPHWKHHAGRGHMRMPIPKGFTGESTSPRPPPVHFIRVPDLPTGRRFRTSCRTGAAFAVWPSTTCAGTSIGPTHRSRVAAQQARAVVLVHEVGDLVRD